MAAKTAEDVRDIAVVLSFIAMDTSLASSLLDLPHWVSGAAVVLAFGALHLLAFGAFFLPHRKD